jgi:hypothetical protein
MFRRDYHQDSNPGPGGNPESTNTGTTATGKSGAGKKVNG